MSEELKLCPFCGSHAKIRHGVNVLWVECVKDECGAETDCGYSVKEAANIWNRRAQPAKPQEQHEEQAGKTGELPAEQQDEPRRCVDVMCSQPAQPDRKHCQWHSDGTPEDLEKVRLNGVLTQERECNVQVSFKSGIGQQDEPVAMVVSKFGDPEAFGEREIEARADLSKIPYNSQLYLRPAAQAVKIEMADVVRATMAVEGCPVLTSNQCHAVAHKLNAKLNGIEP